MPFGADGQHVTIRLIDFDDIERNSFVVTQQLTYHAGKTEKRADLVLLVNGLPLVLIEAKTPVRSSQSWLDAALQIHDDYEQNVPELFVPNVSRSPPRGRNTATAPSAGRSVGLWRDGDGKQSLGEVEKAAASMLCPAIVLDMLDAFATQKGKHRIQIIARYQQVDGVNQIVERVVASEVGKGLMWHFQGSGKSLLMLFAARKLRRHPALKDPDRAGGGRPQIRPEPDAVTPFAWATCGGYRPGIQRSLMRKPLISNTATPNGCRIADGGKPRAPVLPIADPSSSPNR